MISLVPYTNLTPTHHDALLNIRNLPEIVRYTPNQEKIALHEHLTWVQTLRTASHLLYLAVLDQDSVIGAVHAKEIDTSTPVWGIFFKPCISPSITSATAVYFLEYLFARFSSSTIRAMIHPQNLSAQKFNERLGFIADSDTNRSDFCLMSLKYDEWQKRKQSKLFAPLLKIASTLHLKD